MAELLLIPLPVMIYLKCRFKSHITKAVFNTSGNNMFAMVGCFLEDGEIAGLPLGGVAMGWPLVHDSLLDLVKNEVSVSRRHFAFLK